MENPFQLLTDAFHPEYRVNFSIESLDGSVILTLSDDQGSVVAKRRISAVQRSDPQRLRKLIQSVRFGIAIDRGQGLAALGDRQLVPAPRDRQVSPGSPASAG
ncbi:DUF3509 domain-containing protein [Zestomonas carbonaria]|uniref:DUF3509 domain-containing protein n=1 Tax=Zestomonas carbonaria TaxID=2762745 RepID=A0A7U7ENZ6_9GAMM|nr:DUF3509 domain-containing protein [Pseudomonas carbonaria]CAD5108118.1 hypothetical protein PSEWESI4_02402 [Pseudomonas carbonaria]